MTPSIVPQPQPDAVIRVLVVEDSETISRLLVSLLNADPRITVVGVARDGAEAVEMVKRHRPDLVTMDINLPVMDGYEATKQIMAFQPTPILVLSSRAFQGGRDKVFRAISYGALDVVEKSPFTTGGGEGARELIDKIKNLAHVKVIRHPLARVEGMQVKVAASTPATGRRIVALCASTGGPVALFDVLRRLPADFPCSVVVVLHISTGFTEGFVEWIQSECRLRVKLGEEGELLQPGMVYVAPDDRHMRVVSPGSIQITSGPLVDGHRPSATVLLESVAASHGSGAIGIILTGMGRDGAKGMAAVKERSGRTIAQDERTSVIFGMPRAAIELGVVDRVLPLEDISQTLVRWL
ncbi:MAG: chemotaxis-specific protein-glutamate methyltransferase CheB [Nitrospirae bacterium]|nr:chemotaxis-specific protein-glutamate methyltransferase CheB [Nitrospirota bacterium]